MIISPARNASMASSMRANGPLAGSSRSAWRTFWRSSVDLNRHTFVPIITRARGPHICRPYRIPDSRGRRCAPRRFVCDQVNGTICTSNDASSVGNRQADAIDRDRPAMNQIRSERGRIADRDPPEICFRTNRLDSAGPSTCPSTMWPPNRPSGTHRPLEIHERGLHAVTRLVTLPSQGQSRSNRSRLILDNGQADAVDGDAFAKPQIWRNVGSDPQAESASIVVTSATSPTDSINPVNIAFHEHISAERRHAPVEQRCNRQRVASSHPTASSPSVIGAT